MYISVLMSSSSLIVQYFLKLVLIPLPSPFIQYINSCRKVSRINSHRIKIGTMGLSSPSDNNGASIGRIIMRPGTPFQTIIRRRGESERDHSSSDKRRNSWDSDLQGFNSLEIPQSNVVSQARCWSSLASDHSRKTKMARETLQLPRRFHRRTSAVWRRHGDREMFGDGGDGSDRPTFLRPTILHFKGLGPACLREQDTALVVHEVQFLTPRLSSTLSRRLCAPCPLPPAPGHSIDLYPRSPTQLPVVHHLQTAASPSSTSNTTGWRRMRRRPANLCHLVSDPDAPGSSSMRGGEHASQGWRHSLVAQRCYLR